MAKQTRKYGWKKDLPDQRDYVYQISFASDIPESADLRIYCPPVYDQGNLGSCTANAVSGAMQVPIIKAKQPTYTPSRLFLYYNTRAIEGTVSYDSGASIRDSIKSSVKYGACLESSWKYQISKFKDKPTKPCYKEGLTNLVDSYAKVAQNEYGIKSAISQGYPVVIGFSVYSSFESIGKSGIVPMPKPAESVLGGHAVILVGYDDSTRQFCFRNSWSSKWGASGYGFFPYEYMTDKNLSSDFWIIKHSI